MELEHYKTKSNEKFNFFEFVSEGPNGEISKIIKFEKTSGRNIYNLAFGDKINEFYDFDDKSVSDNKDSEKVLMTVASCLIVFMDNHKDALVYATGSTKSRTRL